MLGFVGRFEHSLDAKGRLILPVRFRPEFEQGGDLTQHFEGCLALWTPSEFARQLAEMLELSRAGDADARNRARVWSAGASVVEVDRQGRFAIPASARAFAGLDGDVLVIGSIDHIEIWDPRRFEERVVPAEEYFSGSDLAG
jgi:MraZ protein